MPLTETGFLNEEREEGFSLVELLVVIVIIGILSAIAIMAFLNQRQKANDASVESDLRNTALAVESALVSQPNATLIAGDSTKNNEESVVLTVDGQSLDPISLSEGVSVVVSTEDGKKSGNEYEIKGWHMNGGSYTQETPLTYNSALGGFTDDTTPVAGGGGSEIVPGEGDEESSGTHPTVEDLKSYTRVAGEAVNGLDSDEKQGLVKYANDPFNNISSFMDVEASLLKTVKENYHSPQFVMTNSSDLDWISDPSQGVKVDFGVLSTHDNKDLCTVGFAHMETFAGMEKPEIQEHLESGYSFIYDPTSDMVVHHSELENTECNNGLAVHTANTNVDSIIEYGGGTPEGGSEWLYNMHKNSFPDMY